MSQATPVVLLVLAALLAGPAAIMLSRARWPARAPRAALVLWQSLALAALLSALGAGASAGTLIMTHDRPGPALVALHGVAFVATVAVLARLLWAAHTLGVSLRARRRRQRRLVDLVGRHDGRVPGARVLDVSEPMAYCIPGVSSRLVVSAPVIDQLATDELSAVLAHERTHAKARHDLVLEGFAVLRRAFPRLGRGHGALEATAGLVEMLADDAARRRAGDVPLARALARLAAAPVPAGSLGAGAITPEVRIRRLAECPADGGRVTAALAYLAAAAVLVIPTLTVAAPWLASLAATLPR